MMGPLMPALDLAQDVFDIVRHAFRSGVKVLNEYVNAAPVFGGSEAIP
jgi:hypothetical protein